MQLDTCAEFVRVTNFCSRDDKHDIGELCEDEQSYG